RQPLPDPRAHLAPRRRLAGRDREDEPQPRPGVVATLDGLEESPARVHCEPEGAHDPRGVQVLVDHRLGIVHRRAHTTRNTPPSPPLARGFTVIVFAEGSRSLRGTFGTEMGTARWDVVARGSAARVSTPRASPRSRRRSRGPATSGDRRSFASRPIAPPTWAWRPSGE